MRPVIRRPLLAALLLLGLWTDAWGQGDIDRQLAALPWQRGSQTASIAGVAQLPLRNQWRALDATSSSRFLELNGNPPRSGNYVVAPVSGEWFAVFAFERSGYIRDDEQLDPDELLTQLKRTNEAGMAERRRLGLPVLRLDAWAIPPHYDARTRQLEWGTRLSDDAGRQTVNYTIRLLGRSGVMSAILVSDPQYLINDIAQFRQALQSFEYVSGERYAEYRQGDRVAEYGLAALIVGGAAAAAAKSGLLKGAGKLLGFGALAVLAGIGAFVRKLFARKKPT